MCNGRSYSPIDHSCISRPIVYIFTTQGKIYERKEIEDYIKRQGKPTISPCTTRKMTKEIVPALCVLNNIETGITAGIYSGELAETWKQRMKMKRDVDDAKKRAKGGNIEAMRSLANWFNDGANGLTVDYIKAREWSDKAQVKTWKDLARDGNADAMYELGVSYHEGSHGLERDDTTSFNWYKMASESGCVMATAVIGDRLISGTGTPRNVPSGLIRLACAAKDGSDYACYSLGEYYFKGRHGVAKDFQQAKHWLERAVGEDCNYQHITESYISTARRWIRKIEEIEHGKGDIVNSESLGQLKSAALTPKKIKRKSSDELFSESDEDDYVSLAAFKKRKGKKLG